MSATRLIALLALLARAGDASATSYICERGASVEHDLPVNGRVILRPFRHSTKTFDGPLLPDIVLQAEDGTIIVPVRLSGDDRHRVGGTQYLELFLDAAPAKSGRWIPGTVLGEPPRFTPWWGTSHQSVRAWELEIRPEPDLEAPAWARPTLSLHPAAKIEVPDGPRIPAGPTAYLDSTHADDESPVFIEAAYRLVGATEPAFGGPWSPVGTVFGPFHLDLRRRCAAILPHFPRFQGQPIEATFQLVDVAGNRSVPYTLTFVAP